MKVKYMYYRYISYISICSIDWDVFLMVLSLRADPQIWLEVLVKKGIMI